MARSRKPPRRRGAPRRPATRGQERVAAARRSSGNGSWRFLLEKRDTAAGIWFPDLCRRHAGWVAAGILHTGAFRSRRAAFALPALLDPSRDQSRAALVAHVGPRPLEQHDKAVPNPDQEEYVAETPAEPRDDSRKVQSQDFRHRGGPPDDRHGPAVAISESPGRLAFHRAPDVLGGPAAFLNGDGGGPRQKRTSLVEKRGEISHDENLRMSGDRQVGLDEDPASPVERHARRP